MDRIMMRVVAIRFLGRFDPENLEWIAFILRIRDGDCVADGRKNRSVSENVWDKRMIEEIPTSRVHADFAADVPKTHQL